MFFTMVNSGHSDQPSEKFNITNVGFNKDQYCSAVL